MIAEVIKTLEYASAILVPLAAAVEFCRRVYIKYIKPVLNTVKEIDKQFKPNGGGSMVDKMDAVNGKMDKYGGELQVLARAFNSTLFLDSNPIFKTDGKGNCIFVNYAWLRLTGFTTQEEAFGTGWSRGVHPQDRFLVVDEWERAVASQSQFNMEYRYQNLINNKVTSVSCRTTTIKDNENNPFQIIGVIHIIQELP